MTGWNGSSANERAFHCHSRERTSPQRTVSRGNPVFFDDWLDSSFRGNDGYPSSLQAGLRWAGAGTADSQKPPWGFRDCVNQNDFGWTTL